MFVWLVMGLEPQLFHQAVIKVTIIGMGFLFAGLLPYAHCRLSLAYSSHLCLFLSLCVLVVPFQRLFLKMGTYQYEPDGYYSLMAML
jgi:hypothetical protein